MKRSVVGVSVVLMLALAGCSTPAPVPTPTTDEQIAACMEAEGYPLEKPANEVEGFTMEGMHEAADKCGLEQD